VKDHASPFFKNSASHFFGHAVPTSPNRTLPAAI
jgi:hypothetical protein